MLGHRNFGSGPRRVIVLNDWRCDTSTWDDAQRYLDEAALTWAFLDLRGYGRSRGQSGSFTIEEAAADVLAWAGAQGWAAFSIVGHSMSTLVAMHLAQCANERIERAVVVTPPPPSGFGVDDASLEGMRRLARDAPSRLSYLRASLGDFWSEGWVGFRAQRWAETADPEAVAAYAAMFAKHGLPDPRAPIRCPLLAVTGERDIEIMRSEAVRKLLTPLSDRLLVESIEDSGHYPMQEAPPRFAAIVERFLRATA